MKHLPKLDIKSLSLIFERVLEQLSAKAHQGETILQHAMDEVRQDAVAIYNLTADEAVLLETYIKRDLADASQYLEQSGKEIKDWLGFDLHLIEQALRERLLAAIDATSAELITLKWQVAQMGYHTGEVITAGSLQCDGCGKIMHFRQPGHIPPCAGCKGTAFHRHYS